MDDGYTYSTADGQRASVYADPQFEPPLTVDLTDRETGVITEFYRVTDTSLRCGRVLDVPGECGSAECHIRVLGKCDCGRHPDGVRLVRAS